MNMCGEPRYLRGFRNPAAFIFSPDCHIVSFSYTPELDGMDFAVLDAESLQKFLHRIWDLWGYQPNQNVPLATAYELIPIAGHTFGQGFHAFGWREDFAGHQVNGHLGGCRHVEMRG